MTEYTIEQRIIYRLVEQFCSNHSTSEVSSNGLGASAAAMRYLADIGLIQIEWEMSRAVVGSLMRLSPELYDLGDLEG